ncbi:UNVERIFIED_CONTAM: hypothetical protein GTU68_001186 [Idotea baltica]|nr:hypothetical protein [Idotea baltica]
MGAVVTAAERGSAASDDRPEHPCVGTNALNAYNITRASLGLVRYVVKSHTGEGKPSIALARDTRHFGKEFAEIVGRVATENGCDLHLFIEPRSTPQLSFAVRHLNASAGIVLTASHNPPHDNGYKVYGNDGAQIVEPAAGQIVAEVNSISGDSYEALPESEHGTVHEIKDELDGVYMDRLESLLLDPDLVKAQSDLKIVFTNIHGTGGRISPAMLRRLGFHCDTVAVQDEENGWFPSVKSPNPENAEALQMAMDQAEESGADIVIGTDPDCDRMALRLKHSQFFVFGGEESYGYLGADFLRDKDGNGAVVMFAELAAYAKSQGQTPVELLDELFCEFGIFLEGQHAEVLAGADGAAQIQALAKDYSENPPKEADGSAVTNVRDFANDDFIDEEGDEIPKEKMLIVDLADGRAFAMRPSGTEPKIKFYIYQRPEPGSDPSIAPESLAEAKATAQTTFDSLKSWIVADMKDRLSNFS